MNSDRPAKQSTPLPWWQVLEEELKSQGLGEGLQGKRESLWKKHVLDLWPSALALEAKARVLMDQDGPTAQRLKRALRNKVLPPLPEKPEFEFHDYHQEARAFVAMVDGALGPLTPRSQGGPAGLVDPENEGEHLRRAVQALKEADDIERRWLDSLIAHCHGEAGGRSALCLSGGGIRSATFGLGVIQGLAEHQLLSKFHYLSTVSGGGYLGSWLSAWIHRSDGGVGEVEKALKDHQPKWTLGTPPYAHGPEPQPEPLKVWRLRANSSYLSPQMGLLSADMWTLVALMIRNLLVHWAVLVPLLAALLLLPFLALASAYAAKGWEIAFGLGFPLVAYAFALGQTACSEADSRNQKPTDSGAPKWFLALGILLLAWAWVSAGARLGPGDSFSLNSMRPWVVLPLLVLVPALAGLFTRGYGQMNRLDWVWVAALIAGALVGGLYLGRQDPTAGGSGLPGVVLYALYGLAVIYFMVPFSKLSRASGWKALMFELGIGAALAGGLWSVIRFGSPKFPEWSRWLITCGPALIALLVFFLTSVPVALLSAHPKKQHKVWGALLLLGAFIWLFMGKGLSPSLVLFVGGALLLIPKERPLVGNIDREWYARLGAWSLIVGFGWLVLAGISLYGVGLLLKLPKVFTALTAGGVAAATWGVFSSAGRGGEGKSGLKDLLLAKAAPLGGLVGALLIAILVVVGLERGLHEVIKPVSLEYQVAMPPKESPVALTLRVTQPPNAKEAKVEAHLQSSEAQADRGLLKTIRDVNYWLVNACKRLSIPGDCVLKVQLNDPSHQGPIHILLAGCVGGLLLLGLALSWLFPLGEYSLHSLYRNRLVRAYLGASRDSRHPDMATGFSSLDDFQLSHLAKNGNAQKPLLVINTALNQTFGEQLGWQERKAMSFTMSPLHCGNFLKVGYQRTEGYGGPVSLGTAMTISGAAASPNMGYHSSPLLAFVMTFFSIRLGSWLPNPGMADSKSWIKEYPSLEIFPLVSELFGFSTSKRRYVNLSDGGHFENLGLYEMVARRCKFIVVVDGGEDPKFEYEDLGNALRKIRIDLGIPITFPYPLIPPGEGDGPWFQEHPHVAVAKIEYGKVDGEKVSCGTLIYLKPHLWKRIPADILTYARWNSAFPHQSTGDQFFTESQFESYRALGHELALSALNHFNFPEPIEVNR